MNFQKDRHYSFELERAVIGATMIEKSAFGRMYGILKPDIFYSEDHQKIWECIEEMWENNIPIDNLSVVLKLIKNGCKEMKEGPTQYYVTRCTRDVVSTANLEYWSFVLREMFIDREMLKISQSGMQNKDTWEYMDDLQEKMISLRQVKTTNDFKQMNQLIVNLVSHMDAVKDRDLVGITTGFKTLDKMTSGLMGSDLYIIAARPRVGKSAFMSKMVMKQAQQGIHVAVISLEMNDKKLRHV